MLTVSRAIELWRVAARAGIRGALSWAAIAAFGAASAPASEPAVRFAVLDAISSRPILPNSPFEALGDRSEIVLSAARGEYEPAAVVVRNDSAQSKRIQLEVGDLVGSASAISRAAVDLKHVVVWYQAAGAWTSWRKPRGDMDAFLTPELLVNDPELIRVDRREQHNYLRLTRASGPDYLRISERKLNQGWEIPTVDEQPVYDRPTLQPVEIPAGENRQFWVTIHVPDVAPPDTYTGRIQIRDLQGLELGSIPIALTVYEFDLPAPRIEYSMYYRGKLADHHPTVSDDWKSTSQLIADYASMLAHGITNPTCYQRFWPKEAVERSSPTSSRQLVAKVLAIRRELGLGGRPLYFLGRGTGKSAAPKQLRRLASDTADLLALATSYGASELYLYGADEARGQDVVDQHVAWRTVKGAGAKVFVAGSSDHFEKSDGLTDLLVYHGRPNRKVAGQQHGAGNKIYKYSAPQAGPEDPLLWRKSFGIEVWQADYDGAMPYAFQARDGSLWNDWDGVNYRTEALAYPAADGPISTLAFEGLREGIDDVRYLTALEDAVTRRRQAREGSGADAPALRAASAFLEALKDRSPFDPAIVREQTVEHLRALEAASAQTGAAVDDAR